MTIARSTGVFIGTDDSTGSTIANNATTVGSEVDVLGGTNSMGEMNAFLCFTGSGTTGTVDVKINVTRTTGVVYSQAAFSYSFAPISGTQKIPLGRIAAGRYMNAEVKNNGTGGNITNVTVGYELFKIT